MRWHQHQRGRSVAKPNAPCSRAGRAAVHGGAAWVQRGHQIPHVGFESWKHCAATLPGCCPPAWVQGDRAARSVVDGRET